MAYTLRVDAFENLEVLTTKTTSHAIYITFNYMTHFV